jgi:tRNA 2-thiouridine synthesizing protein A
MQRAALDLRGLKCPMPTLLARRALARATAGGAIEIVCDDPFAPVDVPHMCHHEGYDVLAIERNGAVTRLVLRRPA